MPSSTPDPMEVQTQLLLDIKAGVEKLVTASASSGGTTPSPTPVTPVDTAAAYLAKWSPPTAEEFKARYNVDMGTPKIPAMTEPDVEEAIFRARAGYSWQGAYYVSGNEGLERRRLIGVLAHATDETVHDSKGHPEEYFYSAGGKMDPDMSAFAILALNITLRPAWISSFFVGSSMDRYVGYTIQSFLDSQAVWMHGSPAGPGIG
jgi:hypothetical protein